MFCCPCPCCCCCPAYLQFVSSAQATSTPLPGRRKTAAQSTPTTSGPAPTVHSLLPPQLQQRWAHKSLPACLQHLLTCYQQLAGAADGSSTSSSAAATPSCSQPGMVAAVAGRQQPTTGTLHCCLPVSTKQQSSMDQVRDLAGCAGCCVRLCGVLSVCMHQADVPEPCLLCTAGIDNHWTACLLGLVPFYVPACCCRAAAAAVWNLPGHP